MQQTTTTIIKNYFLNNPPATVKELSEILNLTKADIRYHLKKLISSGMIKSIPDESSQNRGRPAAKFTLAKINHPQNLQEILDIFFEIHRDDSDIFLLLGNNIAEKLDIPAHSSLLSRLNRILPKLNQRNYKSRWESHASGPVIFFHNCPYREILDKYPQLCKMDQFILSKALNTKVVQTHNCLESQSNVCRFEIKKYSVSMI